MPDTPRHLGAYTPSRRLFTDSRGIEWEVVDEGARDMAVLLDWEITPCSESPGLIFSSREGYRRLRPRPDDWHERSDAELESLCRRAAVLI